MNSPSQFRDPEQWARLFAQYVRAIVSIVFWATIGLASLAAGYAGVRAVLVAVRTIFKALGV